MDSSCVNPYCYSPEHAFIREKLNPRIWQTLFGHISQTLSELPAGGNIGVVVPDGQEVQDFAVKLRSFLMGSKAFRMDRWSVRVREDGILVVNKIGRWGFCSKTHYALFVEEPVRATPITCACGCGELTDKGVFLPGHLDEALKKKICPVCAEHFSGKARCCSRQCANTFRGLQAELKKLGAW